MNEKSITNFGKIILNLLSLELLARTFLAKKEKNEQFLPQNTTENDLIGINWLTNFETLGVVLGNYNKYASKNNRVNQNRICKLRDALAHGRILSNESDEFFTLYKFTSPIKPEKKLLVLKIKLR